MNLPVSLAVLALSVALLFFVRRRNGEVHSIFRKSPWIVGHDILWLFAAGLMGVGINLNFLH